MKKGVSEDTVWAIVEAYLFETGKAASLEELVELFKGVFATEELETSLERMEKNRWQEGRGVMLVARRGMWALEVRGKPSLLLKFAREEGSPPDEWSEREKTVLAIIAYEGPVSQGRIDQIMGSECGHLVMLLQERGLVKKKGGKMEVTPTFYGFFGLSGREKLMDLERKNDKEATIESDPVFEEFCFAKESGQMDFFYDF